MIRKILCFFGIHKYDRRIIFKLETDYITQPYCIYCNTVPNWWYR